MKNKPKTRELKMLLFLKRTQCFFLGHDENMGYPENYEDPYCSRCDKSWPLDDFTWPGIKENIYWRLSFLRDIMKSKCSYDPRVLKGKPIGMFHCPECGEMVIASLPHYDEKELL